MLSSQRSLLQPPAGPWRFLPGKPDQQAAFAAWVPAGLLGAFLTISRFRSPTGDFAMNITTLSLIALAITGLALIHETRLRRAAHNVFCRLFRSLRHKSKGYDHARDRK